MFEIKKTSSVEPAKQKATFGATGLWTARAALKAGRSLFAFSGADGKTEAANDEHLRAVKQADKRTHGRQKGSLLGRHQRAHSW